MLGFKGLITPAIYPTGTTAKSWGNASVFKIFRKPFKSRNVLYAQTRPGFTSESLSNTCFKKKVTTTDYCEQRSLKNKWTSRLISLTRKQTLNKNHNFKPQQPTSIFIASMIISVSPSSTFCPGCTST